MQVELAALHVHFICIGLNCQCNIRKMHCVIQALHGEGIMKRPSVFLVKILCPVQFLYIDIDSSNILIF